MDLWLLEVFFVAAAISPPSLIPAFWLSPPSFIPAFWLSPFGLWSWCVDSGFLAIDTWCPLAMWMAIHGIFLLCGWLKVVCWTYDFLISWRPEKFYAFSIFIVAEHTAHALEVFL